MTTKLKDYHMPKAICPHCGYITDGALEAQPECKPGPGDVSLCMACCGVALFTEDMCLRLPTRSEIIAIRTSPDWVRVVQATEAIRELNERIPGPKPPKHS